MDEVLGERHIQRDDGHRHEHGARREDGELAVVQRIEPHRHRPGGLVDEKHARQHKVRPRPRKRRERRVDDHRLGERKRDRHKYPKIACSVQRGSIVDGARDGIEKPLLHEKSHRGTAAIQKNEPPEVVDEVKLRHDDEQRSHVHEVGEDAQNERRLHHCLAALEAVARNGVSHRNDQESRNDTAHRGNESHFTIEKSLTGVSTSVTVDAHII